jgi:hypothetical protein
LKKNSEKIKGDQWQHPTIKAVVYHPYLCGGGRVGRKGQLFAAKFCVNDCRWLADLIVWRLVIVLRIPPSYLGF